MFSSFFFSFPSVFLQFSSFHFFIFFIFSIFNFFYVSCSFFFFFLLFLVFLIFSTFFMFFISVFFFLFFFQSSQQTPKPTKKRPEKFDFWASVDMDGARSGPFEGDFAFMFFFSFLCDENLIILGLNCFANSYNISFEVNNFLSRLEGYTPLRPLFLFLIFHVFHSFYSFLQISLFFCFLEKLCFVLLFFSVYMPLLAFVLGFTKICFLHSRCSVEMWCLDDIGRDSWDWVAPPTWEREKNSTPQSGVQAPRLLKRSL